MQLQELTHLFQHPEAITADQTDALSLKINEYPYFQSLRALHLKGLKLKKSYIYNNALKVTAAYTADRSVLFDYITSDAFNQNEISKQIKQNSETIKTIEVQTVTDITVNKSVSIDDVLRAQIKATEGVLNPDLFEAKTAFELLFWLLLKFVFVLNEFVFVDLLEVIFFVLLAKLFCSILSSSQIISSV